MAGRARPAAKPVPIANRVARLQLRPWPLSIVPVNAVFPMLFAGKNGLAVGAVFARPARVLPAKALVAGDDIGDALLDRPIMAIRHHGAGTDGDVGAPGRSAARPRRRAGAK